MSDEITPPTGFRPPSEPPISDDDVEALLRGTARPDHEDLAHTIAALRSVPRPPVGVGPELAEFVAAPTRPPYVDELPPVPPAAPARRQSVLARPLARMALVAGIGVVGVTGAHAAGMVDVPGLPDRGDGTEVVFADDDAPPDAAGVAVEEPETDGSDDETGNGSILEDPVEATVTYGDLSVAISIGSPDGQSFSIDIDVEGVSPECEAALEGLSGTYTSEDEVEAAAGEAEAACEGDFDLVFPDLDDPDAFEAFLDEFDFSLNLPEDFGRFFDDEFGGIGGFDLDQLEQLVEDFDFDRLQEYFGEHGDGGFSFDLDELPDGFDPEQFEGFFENLDPESLQGFLGDFDPEQFEQFFDELDPESLQGFLGDFDPEQFEQFFDELPFEFGELDGDHGGDIEDFFDDFFDDADLHADEIGA